LKSRFDRPDITRFVEENYIVYASHKPSVRSSLASYMLRADGD
jgi:hypothetical protein